MGWVLTVGRALTLHRQIEVADSPLTSIQLLLGKESDFFSATSSLLVLGSLGCLLEVLSGSLWELVVMLDDVDVSIMSDSEAGVKDDDDSLSVRDSWDSDSRGVVDDEV